MAFLENIFSLIDMRSFSSVWFWIVLALYWSAASQFVLGASFDLIMRARKDAGQNMDDLQTLVAIHVRRKLTLMRRTGHWIVGFAAALLTLIVMLAFVYWLEIAQAVFFLIFPMMLVRLLELRLSFRIEREALHGAKLCRALLRFRFWVQFLGVITIFITAIWGMLHVLSRSALSF
ncbi:component of SufBCD complex [Roseinatronobacter sp.]|uniref:component of SufBCD complex n=1 Tax=Roseinatronobacter sp. TaxID=1945755 RepID=UPI0025D765D9|nr:component of SufBCD complex [Rhodobaca sp.]